ncbi:P2Y purinoceptor 4-like [Pholidichthys leucotaenia]
MTRVSCHHLHSSDPAHSTSKRRYGKRDTGTELICYDTTSPEFFDDFLLYSSVVSVFMFVLPFMVVMVCYGLMLRKLLEPGWESEVRPLKVVPCF